MQKTAGLTERFAELSSVCPCLYMQQLQGKWESKLLYSMRTLLQGWLSGIHEQYSLADCLHNGLFVSIRCGFLKKKILYEFK